MREQKCEDLEKDLCYHLPALFEKLQNSLDASFSWYETSCLSYSKYSKCEGDQSLNWGERGYSTVFDLLQVFTSFMLLNCYSFGINIISYYRKKFRKTEIQSKSVII